MTVSDRLRTLVSPIGVGRIGISGLTMAALTLAAMPVAMAAFGKAEDYQLGFQDPVTDNARYIGIFNTYLTIGAAAITLFVMALLLYVIVKFNAKANPTPAHFHHNTTLEVLWTVIPIAILVVISVPSFRLLYAQYAFPKPDVTIKAIGNQWYWSYEYIDAKGVAYDSYMLKDDETAALRAKNVDAPRLLAVDNEVVVPVNKVVHVLITAKDVIHNWNIPSFGIKTDGVPGRVTANWFKADRVGIYYGVCSELCGAQHAYMPIAVRVVSEEAYKAWLEIRKTGGKGVDDKARAVIQAWLPDPKATSSVALLGAAATPQTP